MDYMKRIGYLKGLTDGLAPDTDSKEGKLLHAVVDALEALAHSMSDMEDIVDSVEEQLDDVMDELDEMDEKLDEALVKVGRDGDNIRMFDGNRPHEHETDPTVYQLVCPACQKEFLMDEDMLAQGAITCPNCKELLEFETHCDEHGCGCCGHTHDDEDEENGEE